MAALSPGTRLSTYEVVEPIGKGGMGEVYRARDAKLERDVAIKVLPDDLSRDKERLARFRREAKLLAQLNHSNIATLYGFEDGYIIMELVEGETLAERIARGPIPIDDALPLFIEIAEGLAAAHDKTIVHRDLKPANIKIGPDEKPKILDFGLAKAFSPEEDVSAETSQSPTLTRLRQGFGEAGTQLGAIMGTASYMSPEQARGKSVDKRTDIWAFGCCLYEALTGKKPFAGDTVTDVLAAVVQNEPDYSAVTSRVRKLLRRCLAKTKNERYHDIADVRLELGDIGSASVAAPRQDRRFGWWSYVAIAVLAALAGYLLRPTSEDTPARVRRVAVPTSPADGVGIFPGEFPQPAVALSPDGTTLVFVGFEAGVQRLYLRRLHEPTATPLEGTEAARSPFFSPDGLWVGFSANRRLQKVQVGGGTPTVLCEVNTLTSVHWADPDWIYFTGYRGAEILRVSSSGGTPTPVAETPDGFYRGHHVLPGGSGFVVAVDQRLGDGISNILVIDGASGEGREIIRDGTRPVVVESGYLLFVRGLDLMAARFDTSTGTLYGEPVAIIRGIDADGKNFSVSAEGTLAFVPAAATRRRLVRVDRNGRPEPLSRVERGFGQGPRLSPDGTRVAVLINEEGSPEVFLLDVARDTLSRLTFSSPSGAFQPNWSPDGDFVYFHSDRTGTRTLFRKRSDGSGEAEQLLGTPMFPTSIASDATHLVFHKQGEGSGWDISVILLEDPPRAEPLLRESYNEHTAKISPDDRWLAYVSNEDGRDEVYIQAFPALGQKRKVSSGGGREPLWSRDGGELFYRQGDAMLSVAVRTGNRLELAAPRILFERHYQSSRSHGTYYDAYADGAHFVMIEDEPVRKVSVIFGFFNELERLIPASP